MTPPKPLTVNLAKQINDWLTDLLHDYEPRHIRDKKVIRDAVFDFTLFWPHEIGLIDSPLLQRLRFVRQTSLACTVYPSAAHSRFEHSLGCVAIANRIAVAVNSKRKQVAIEETAMAEIRLAALLHDCGHGPFSHASEFVYDELSTEIEGVRSENKTRFDGAAGHEILSYLIVTSKRFGRLWDDIRSKYDSATDDTRCDLGNVNLGRVASMILGLRPDAAPKYLSSIINGPFDADKFDYIIRDGYFSGLVTSIDIERLAVSLDIAPLKPGDDEKVLCMDIGGATILEQLLFNKMLLFSSMYHHHKVRAAFRQLVRLFREARDNDIALGDADLRSAVGFLRLDDSKVLTYAMQNKKLEPLARSICERRLPMRALVIDRQTLSDAISNEKWQEFNDDHEGTFTLERKIAKKSKLKAEDVYVDFPPRPRIEKTAQLSMIRRASDRPLVSLDSLYPVAGWLGGYGHYRFRSYILCPSGCQERVASAAQEVLSGIGISLDVELAKRQAKWQS